MLKKMTIENFGVVNEKITFSMESKKTEQFPENIIEGTDLLKTIYIYGANNSGKTKMIESIKLLTDILKYGKEVFYLEPFSYMCNLKNYGNDKTSKINYEFEIEKKIYMYSLEINFTKKIIIREELFVDSKNIFVRNSLTINKDKWKIEEDVFFLLFHATHSGELEDVSIFYEYLKKIIFLDQQRKSSVEINESNLNEMEKIVFLEKNIKRINKSLVSFGFNFELEVMDFGKELQNKKSIYVRKNDFGYPIKLLESFGTNVFIDLLLTIELKKDECGIIVIDEIERGVHYGLVAKFIEYINENYPCKQLILTTHMTDLLDCKLKIRKDQVYITEIDDDSNFLIKRAFNKQAIRETMNFQKVLKSGAVGGLPSIENK
ncbi:MAG: AAA family ATPase [Fusobacteriaceae bacterium]